jgi:hypothetical protein
MKPFDPSFGLIISDSLNSLLKQVLKIMIFSETEILLKNREMSHPGINYWATVSAPSPRNKIVVTLQDMSASKEE